MASSSGDTPRPTNPSTLTASTSNTANIVGTPGTAAQTGPKATWATLLFNKNHETKAPTADKPKTKSSTVVPSNALTAAVEHSVVSRETHGPSKHLNSGVKLGSKIALAEQKPQAVVKPSLETMPNEILCQILEPLLVNPILGTAASIDGDDGNWWNNVKYHLSPSTIGISRRIKAVAESLLYERNDFFMSCAPNQDMDDEPVQAITRDRHLSPLTRRVHSPTPLWDCPGIAKVRHWKVFINISTDEGVLDYPAKPYYPTSLNHFCRAIASSRPKSLQLYIIPSIVDEYLEPELPGISDRLGPLSMLRGIGTATFKNATLSVIPLAHRGNINNELNPENINLEQDPRFRNNLLLLIESDSPVEYPFKMFPLLLRYAQAFERNHEFTLIDREHDCDYCQQNYHHCASNNYHGVLGLHSMNRYIKQPLEATIESCRVASNQNNIEKFKSQRTLALEYLEPQYIRIRNASQDLIEFIKEEKITGGIFDTNASVSTFQDRVSYKGLEVQVTAAMVLLEDYIKSFERQLSFELRVDLRIQRKLEKKTSERDRVLKQLYAAVECRDYQSFRKLYTASVDNLDEQYLEIRGARKALFDFDILDTPLPDGFDMQASLCDEKVNWQVNEPDFFPESIDAYDHWDWEDGKVKVGSHGRSREGVLGGFYGPGGEYKCAFAPYYLKEKWY